jgi:hypothetical protein
MSVTSNSVANQAIALAGDNIPPVQGSAPTFDSSAAGLALQQLYAPCVRTVLREFGWDFARNFFTLVFSGKVAPVGWAYEYVYPPVSVGIMQITPPTLTDVNNPLPQNWLVGNTLVASVQTKVIWSNLASAVAVMNNAPIEATWDASFQEAVVRLLASELSMALFGRPDTSAALLESGGAFETIAESRPG